LLAENGEGIMKNFNLNQWLETAEAYNDTCIGITNDLISHHTFMLPFKWSPNNRDGFISKKEFETVIKEYLSIPGWTSHSFSLDRVVDYNEFHYFYDYVREALYDYGSDDNVPGLIRHLECEGAKGGKYLIETPIPKAQRKKEFEYNDGSHDEALRKTYELEIDSVLLHLYYAGVGVLSFHLNNRRQDQASPEDILYINQYGRRVFPPFYRIPGEKVGFTSAFREDDFEGKSRPHGSEVAYSVAISMPGQSVRSQEKWPGKPVEMLDPSRKLTFKLAGFISPFLGVLDKKYRIRSVLDDRMFTVCWYGNEQLTKALIPKLVVKPQAQFGKTGNVLTTANEEDHLNAITQSDWWYKFTFVDNESVTVQHPEMRRQVLQKASYLRWAGYGTFYGITDYSFVLLTPELKVLRQPWINAAFLVTHLQTIYFRLCELVLVQRACVQRFSDEVTHVSSLDVPELDNPAFDEWVKDLSAYSNELYKRYIRFVNRVYFREVTAQVQGIELYDKLQQQARLPIMVEGLKEEIHELHNYVKQETDRQLLAAEQKRERIITLLGAVFVAPALLLAAYDMDFQNECFVENVPMNYYVTVGAAVASGLMSYVAYQVKDTFIRGVLLVGFFGLLLLPQADYWWCNETEMETIPLEIKSEVPQMVPFDTIKSNQDTFLNPISE
jgi:hypothetical protein